MRKYLWDRRSGQQCQTGCQDREQRATTSKAKHAHRYNLPSARALEVPDMGWQERQQHSPALSATRARHIARRCVDTAAQGTLSNALRPGRCASASMPENSSAGAANVVANALRPNLWRCPEGSVKIPLGIRDIIERVLRTRGIRGALSIPDMVEAAPCTWAPHRERCYHHVHPAHRRAMLPRDPWPASESDATITGIPVRHRGTMPPGGS
jgi:hypothetical protein